MTARDELPEPETFRYGLSSLMVRKSDYDTLRAAYERVRGERDEARAGVAMYATAARVIHLYLADFCDESLPFVEMIAEAARKAAPVIRDERIRAEAAEAKLRECEKDLQEFKESYHRRVQEDIKRFRESMRVRKVIGRHKDYDEMLQILTTYYDEGQTVIVAIDHAQGGGG